MFSCELENPSDGINVNDVIMVNSQKTSILANGIDNTIITATLGSQSEDNKKIEFITDDGMFKGSENDSPKKFSITSSLKEAHCILISGTEEKANVLIQAKVGNYTNITTVDFKRAFAEVITVEASKLTIKSDGNDISELKVSLYRNVGQPTNKAIINFLVEPLDTALIDIVPLIYSDEKSKATTQIKSKNGYPGKVKITASTEAENSNLIESSLVLTIK